MRTLAPWRALRVIGLIALAISLADAPLADQVPIVVEGYPVPMKGNDPDGYRCYQSLESGLELCHEPWVSLTHNGSDERRLAEVWYCENRGRQCYSLRDSDGCGCSGSTDFPEGWTLTGATPSSVAAPAAVLSTSGSDYRAEITEEVIDPCFLTMIRNKGGVPNLSEDEALNILKTVQAESVESMIQQITPLLEGQDRGTRTSLYRMFSKTCIEGGTGG